MIIPILHGEKELKRNEGIYNYNSWSEPKTAVGTQVSYTQFSSVSIHRLFCSSTYLLSKRSQVC